MHPAMLNLSLLNLGLYCTSMYNHYEINMSKLWLMLKIMMLLLFVSRRPGSVVFVPSLNTVDDY